MADLPTSTRWPGFDHAALAMNVVEHSHLDDPTRVERARHASKAAAKALATARLRRAPAFNRWSMTD